MLINLIQNGIKFSELNKVVFIEVQLTDPYSRLDLLSDSPCNAEYVDVTIKVTDQGMGISTADRKNLFKPFFRTQDD